MAPCVVCGSTVRARQQTLRCDRCDRRQHRTCNSGMSQTFYRQIRRGEVDFGEWLCSRCRPTRGTYETIPEEHVTEENVEVSDCSHVDGSVLMPHVTLEDSIRDVRVEDDLPVGQQRDVTFTFIERGTKKGRPKLTDNLGYAYTIKRRPATNVRYWECAKRPKKGRCPASVVERTGVFRRGDNFHNHPPVVNCLTNVKIQAEVRAKAVEDVFKSAYTIVQETLLAMVDETAPNPGLPRISNLVRMANRKRETLSAKKNLQNI
ncbi:uncharacterized protein LOC118410022 isoform X2 [Branchiostoma floridae]|uniref:Uncharacterized protein LOC118410022 isoform X2 n=1 Tax=Branchiostoma floridae TaxID=7739 RepID=A0A9J7MGX8_BRAFL|nr:uncharacterized protein LOC118410022 isoform X2 [Branchiostoma floridae]